MIIKITLMVVSAFLIYFSIVSMRLLLKVRDLRWALGNIIDYLANCEGALPHDTLMIRRAINVARYALNMDHDR